MAPKRLIEIPPPSASSSEDEEEENESQEEAESDEEEADPLVQKQEEGEEDDNYVEEQEQKEEKELPLLKKQTVPATPEKSDSDSDSESTLPSPTPSSFTIKLHKPSPEPNKIGSKRAADSESLDKEVPSKKKSKAAGGGGDEEPKKGSAHQRLWSEDDEIAILDGLNRYKSEKGADPYADMNAFHEFIKKSLHVDVSKNQLIDKIRRLKKKFQVNIEKGENGQDPVFAKTHDLKSFELSKKVWGIEEGNNDKNEKSVKRTSRAQNNGSGVTLALASTRQMRSPPNGEVKTGEKFQVKSSKNIVEKDQLKIDVKEEDKGENVENLWVKYPFLRESLDMEPLSEGVKVTLREQLGMIDKAKLKELEHKWKSLKQAELELFLQRMELVHEQVKLALDSINS